MLLLKEWTLCWLCIIVLYNAFPLLTVLCLFIYYINHTRSTEKTYFSLYRVYVYE